MEIICGVHIFATLIDLFIAGEITAWRDLWIIGDDFINEIFHELQRVHEEAGDKNRQDLFIYDYFNVKCFTPNPLSMLKNVTARLVNAFVKALNENNRMPSFILVIPDWNLPKFINFYGEDSKQVLHDVMKWVVTNFTRVIQSKKDSLTHRKIGAIHSEPVVIWVKMINRHAEFHRVLKLRTKFNAVLQDIISEKKGHYCIDVNYAVSEVSYFNTGNKLSVEGMRAYWRG